MRDSKIKINEKERYVLEALTERYNEETNCYNFRGIARIIENRILAGAKSPIIFPLEDSGIKEIRRACRSLARKGLAQFVKGLFNYDGMVAGAGYCATDAGQAILSPCDICGELAVYDYEVDDKGEMAPFDYQDGRRVLECEEHYKQSAKKTI